MKTEPRALRVCLAPTEVAGYYAQLQRGFEELGCRVIRLSLAPDARRYTEPRAFWPSRLALRLRLAAHDSPTTLLERALSKCASVALSVLAIRAILCSDVLVYGYGATISWYPRVELRFARWLGRRIVFIFHGSDSRPPYLDPQIRARNVGMSISTFRQIVAECHATVRRCDSLADEVIDNPFSAQFHGRTCVNWHAIGIPCAVVPLEPPPPPNDRVRVLHAPSHPETKGTPLIRDAIARLCDRGLPIDYVEIVGRSNEDVLTELARCDLVIDQAYSDVPMAGLATEAAGLGRPSIVGSLATAQFAQFIAPDDMPPTYVCHPDDIETAIERLVRDRALREQLGRAAHAFVLRHRTAVAVATRMMRVLRGDVPDEWRFDPGNVRYAGGCGSPVTNRNAIAELVNTYGPSALELDDRPALRDLVLGEGALSSHHSLDEAPGRSATTGPEVPLPRRTGS